MWRLTLDIKWPNLWGQGWEGSITQLGVPDTFHLPPAPPTAWLKNYSIWFNLMDCWTVNMLRPPQTAVLLTEWKKCDGWAGEWGDIWKWPGMKEREMEISLPLFHQSPLRTPPQPHNPLLFFLSLPHFHWKIFKWIYISVPPFLANTSLLHLANVNASLWRSGLLIKTTEASSQRDASVTLVVTPAVTLSGVGSQRHAGWYLSDNS